MTLENKNDCKCIKYTWKFCFWGMCLCSFVLILRLEWDQSDPSYRVLVVELWVHMYFPGCWFIRLGGYLFSILWMTVKIYAPRVRSLGEPFARALKTTFLCHTSSCCNQIGSLPRACCVTQWQSQSEHGDGDKEATDEEITVTTAKRDWTVLDEWRFFG